MKYAELKVGAKVPYYLADQNGYFTAAGIKVATTYFTGGAAIVPALQAGQVQIGHVNLVSFVFANLAGANLVCLTSSDSSVKAAPDTSYIFVKANSNIQSLSDLKGKTIAVNDVKSLNWVFTAALLQTVGLKPSDVKFVELPFPNMQDALANGQINAAVNVEPFDTQMKNAGLRELSPDYVNVLPGADLGCEAAEQSWVSSHTDVAKAFAAAYDKGKTFAVSNEAATRKAIVDWAGLSQSVASSIVLSYWHPGIDVASAQKIVDMMYKFGLIKTDPDFSAWTLK